MKKFYFTKEKMKNSEQEQQIKKWLKTQGYPLEMFVAKIFSSEDFFVEEGIYYHDSDKNKSCEIDLAATLSYNIKHVRVNISFIIECKSGKFPWVVFSKENRLPDDTYLSNLEGTYIAHNFFNLLRATNKTSKLFDFSEKRIGYRIIQANKSNNIDSGYTATIKLSKAISAFAKDTTKTAKHACNIYFPLLVIDTPIYESYLGKSNNILLNKADTIRIISRKQNNNFLYTIIDVVNKDTIQKYIHNKINEITEMTNSLLPELEETIEKYPENKVEIEIPF